MPKNQIVTRLNQLQSKWCDDAFLESYYGIKPEEQLLGHFRIWESNLRKRIDILSPGKYNRHALETFFQSKSVIPIKFAAIKLGLDLESFEITLAKIEEKNLQQASMISQYLVDEEIIQNFSTFFKSISFKVFENHDSYCKAIHLAIKKEFGITVNKQMCQTSSLLSEKEFAHDYDSLTDEPVGLRYQVWLNTNKPIHLKPDICSLKTFAIYENILKNNLFFNQENHIDNDILTRIKECIRK